MAVSLTAASVNKRAAGSGAMLSHRARTGRPFSFTQTATCVGAPSVRAGGRRCLLAEVGDDAGVHGLAGAGDDLEVHLVLDDLEEHEGEVFVERLLRQGRARLHVALAELPARARDEVVDALLRLDALVEVLVPGQHDVDA